MRSRRGFTLIEVLVTTVVLTIAFTAILGMMVGAMSRAKQPNQPVIAMNLAAERLAYFRSQPNPYTAAGGTFHQPPRDSRDKRDFNLLPGYTNNFNGQPTMLVREFLYAPDAQGGEAARRYQNREDTTTGALTTPGGSSGFTNMTFAINEVPPTLSAWQRILPNNDLLAANDVNLQPQLNLPGPDGSTSFGFGVAPRANDRLRGATFVPAGQPDPLPYVREVWVQTHHPLFDNSIAAPAFACVVPNAGGGSIPRAVLNAALAQVYPTVPPGIAVTDLDPERIPNLPPYSVAVTVRVYAKYRFDPGMPAGVRTYPGAALVASGRDRNPYRLWYDPTRPLAVMTSIIALKREF